MNYAEFLRDVPDFPKPGILFKDITTLLKNGPVFSSLVSDLVNRYKDYNLDAIVGIESRGFIFGAPLAAALEIGFVPARKPGKLPAETVGAEYELEYGTDKIEMHRDAVSKGDRILIVDDLIATGGTAEAAVKIVRSLEAEVVELFFLVELVFLKGREKFGDIPVHSLVRVDGE